MNISVPLGSEISAIRRIKYAIEFGSTDRDLQLLLHQILADLDLTITGYGGERTAIQAYDADECPHCWHLPSTHYHMEGCSARGCNCSWYVSK